MDPHSLDKLEFERVKTIVSRYARGELGRKLIRRLQPSNREKLVRLWLEETAHMVVALNRSGPPPLAGAADVYELVEKVQPGVNLGGEEYYRIGQTLRATHSVHGYLKELPPELHHLHQLGEKIGDFQAVAWRIDEVVDAAGRVRDIASDRLMKIRAQIADHRQGVRRVFDRLLKTPAVAKILQYPNWTYQGDRMVLPVAANHRHHVPGIIHRSSDTGATLFIEPADVVELNNAIVKLGQEEQQEISRIFWELAHLIHLNRGPILIAIRGLARLDMLVAKAAYAIETRSVLPQIDQHNILRLWQARHPLLVELFKDKSDHQVVPIDVRVGDDFDLLVITGPNTGGKTVALKTVGILVLMAQAGMFIPASPGSSLPVFDDVFIDVGDEQSLQQSLSTFSSHLSRILAILKHATRRSLVLLDELGAGTDPDEGAAIGQAILDELLSRKTLTLASTHLGQLKGYAYRRSRVDNAAVEFDPDTLSATYRLRIGEPGNSNAMIIAEHLGMSGRLRDRAAKYISEQSRTFQQAINATLDRRRQAEQARAQAEAATQAAEERQKELDEQIGKLNEEQRAFHQWLDWINSLKPGQPVYVKKLRREGAVIRMELHKQQALVSLGKLAAEVPITELVPPARIETNAG
jgi:DNA mismatch repair protein MutS2